MKARLAAAAVVLALAASTATAQSRITRVSTSNLRLAAGDTAAQLTVEGADLSNVTSVRLLLNGRVVTGVEGTVQRSGSSVLGIRLSASNAVAAGNYQLELVSAGDRILVPVQVTIAAAARRLPGRSVNDMRPPARAIGNVPVPVPSVSNATPTAVSLEPGTGANTKTVTVYGTRLDDVRAAYVERNGVRVSGVSAVLQSNSGASERTIRLVANSGAPLDQPLDLVLEAGTAGNAVKVATPVRVTVALPAFRFKGDAPLREPLESRLTGIAFQFNSCGATSAVRTFMITMPGLGYNARGSVPRLEYAVNPGEQAQFAVAHSLKPNDVFNPATLVNLGQTGHPSPIPHGVSAVRLCMLPMAGGGKWDVEVSQTKTAALNVVITATYPLLVFRGRGMPAAPGGFPTGLNIGILWGNAVTDTEIPNLVYSQPTFEVRFPLTVANGTLVQGSADVTFTGPPPKWSAAYEGPSSVRERMEQHANARVQQMRREIEKAFNASNPKKLIPDAIMASLRGKGVGELVAIRYSPQEGVWSVTYRN